VTLKQIEARSFLVGGAVRDRLLGRPVKDRDFVVVGVSPEAMLAAGFQNVGADFPVFLHPHTKEEYALARTERKTGRGYTGFAVHAGPDVTLEEDLRRRDFTINAMAQDVDGNLVDPYGGQRDLALRTLRHVSEAFGEDPVRILRAARFLARYVDYKLAPVTLALMQAMVVAGEADHLVPERVWAELQRALTEAKPSAFLRALSDCGALSRVAPELAAVYDPGRQVALDACPDAAPKDDQVAYAVLCRDLAPAAVATLSARLKVPVEHRDLARLVASVRPQSYGALDSEARMAVFESLDALRRPERARRYWVAYQLIQGNEPGAGFESDLERIRNVTAEPLLARGITGTALGAELRRARVLALAQRD